MHVTRNPGRNGLSRLVPVLAIGLLVITAVAQTAVTSAFTYQSQIKMSGQPFNGTADLQFSLFNAAGGGSQVGATQTVLNASVSNGLFTTQLDFGAGAFSSSARWVEIAVRTPAGSGSYTTLSPRQPLTAAPYAAYALAAGNGSALDAPDGSPTNAVYVNPDGLVGIGTTSPFMTLHVNGGIYARGGAPGALGGNQNGYAFRGNSGDNDSGMYSLADGQVNFFTQATERMRIDSNGNMGIGTTTPNASFRLQTAGGSGVWRGAIAATGTLNSAVMGELNNIATIGGHNAALSAWSDLLINPGGGNVGIGLAGVPSWKLDVGGTIKCTGFILAGSGAGAGKVLTSDSVGEATWTALPTSLPPSGPAGGDLTGTYPNPTLALPFTRSVGVASPGAAFTITNTGGGHAIHGLTSTASSAAVWGEATVASGSCTGVYGTGSSSLSGVGVHGTALTNGVLGAASHATALSYGVYGVSPSTAGTGVYGTATAASGTTYGVYGNCTSPAGYGVWAQGRFGASGTKSFRIDHPSDPENKYLQHYCAEGPEPLNVYSGSAQLDADGNAWVNLPDYFAQINRDPRVQLTAVGAAMPNLHVGRKVTGNRFQIAGGASGAEVFWRVEAVRNDLWVRQYGAPVEVEKTGIEKGTYQHPELYGQPKEKGLHYREQIETPSAELEKPNGEIETPAELPRED